MTDEPDLDDPADRHKLMLHAADHAALSSAHQLRGWFASKHPTGLPPAVTKDQDDGLVRGVWNHAEFWLRGMYEAPVYFSSDPRPWLDDEPAWVINLQDGWQNLRTGIERGAISYTLVALRRPFISVVAPVFSDRWYMAAAGVGAWQQDRRGEPRRIQVSSVDALGSSALSFGLPADDNSAAAFRPATRMRPKTGALRLTGCSSLDLVDVASGATQGHFEASVNHADVAAALLILREAGGEMTDWQGEYLNPQRITDPMNMAVSNGRVHGEMLKTLSKIKAVPAALRV